jgi:hypothetical protein
MIADCDLRTSKLIEREVRRELERQHGSIYELTIFKIQHENDQVTIMGEFTERPGEQEKQFAMTMPRVDGPLDYFL